MTLMRVRTQEERDTIVSNLKEPFSVENFLSHDEVSQLVDMYYSTQNKIEKNTGPVTTELRDLFKTDPLLKRIHERMMEYVGECVVYTGLHFNVKFPHIIHNDDDKLGPVVYKAMTLPLQIEYEEGVGDVYPNLCMFDQYYLEGPAKFFGGTKKEIPSFYNEPVYEYSQVQNKSTVSFDPLLIKKYFTHLQPFWLNGLSFNSAHVWKPGNAVIFDAVRLHCASDFKTQGIKSKLGLSVFTALAR
jgi:hypothetical protein